MTVSTTIIKNSYSGDGSTTVFAYQFKISADADMQVIIRSSVGVETVKTLTTHYTVSGAGTATGGNVTFTSGNTPASGETVILRRVTTRTQTLDLVENDPFTADSVEGAFDKNLSIGQEIQEEVDRSFKVSRTNTISSAEFTDDATTRANKALGFDSSGDLTTIADFLPAGGDSALFKYSTTTSEADPGAGVFRMNNATFSSVTELYIDDADLNGLDVSAWVQSFDDVTGNDTNRGRIRVQNAGTLTSYITFKVRGAISDESGYTKVLVTHIASDGTIANDTKCFISFVANGEDGAIPGYFYKFDTGTSDADPGAGEIAFNNGTYASVTEIYIDDADSNGGSTATDVQSWGSSTSTIKGFIHIVDINDSSTYARFKITAAVTDASGYNKITVEHLASNNTFSAADELSVHFTRTGLKGDTGATGATGSTGATGATGASGTNSQLSMTFESTTSDADPGNGKIAFNNGTLSSVSILYIDDADDAGADISGYVQSFDDVSNSTARGIITVTKEGTASTFALFKVSGAVTDASGYTKVPVTHVVSSGTFSDNDGVGVHFSYSGADGSGSLSNVVEDTSPQLGGTLDVNSNLIDMNGLADGLVLDTDGDTTISAPTDDQIDIEIAGADDFTFTANTFTALSGSDINIASGATITNNGTAIGFGTRPNVEPLIINGEMQINQRGDQTGITGNHFPVDRFGNQFATFGTWSTSKSSDTPAGKGFAASLKLDCTTADTSLGAGDFGLVHYRFEGSNLQLLEKGTSDAKKVTVSFYVKSAKTGTYILELFDVDNSRQISKSYTINSANTWEQKVIVFEGDTSGVLDNDNNHSLAMSWWLGAGSTYSGGTLNTSWASNTNANRAVGVVNLADSTSNDWYLTGVQFEVGEYTADTLPPFQHESQGESLMRCKRYFNKLTKTQDYQGVMTGFASASNNCRALMYHTPEMRGTPTITKSGDFIRSHGSATALSFTVATNSTRTATIDWGASVFTAEQGVLITFKTGTAFIQADAEL